MSEHDPDGDDAIDDDSADAIDDDAGSAGANPGSTVSPAWALGLFALTALFLVGGAVVATRVNS